MVHGMWGCDWGEHVTPHERERKRDRQTETERDRQTEKQRERAQGFLPGSLGIEQRKCTCKWTGEEIDRSKDRWIDM